MYLAAVLWLPEGIFEIDPLGKFDKHDRQIPMGRGSVARSKWPPSGRTGIWEDPEILTAMVLRWWRSKSRMFCIRE